MSTFNMTRFGKILRWSLWHDKPVISKIVLQTVATLSFIVLFFLLVDGNKESVFSMHFGAFAAIEVCSILFMGTYLYYGMKTQSDWQQLMMLPASNLEKFLARYAVALVIALGMILSVFVADVVQYVATMIIRPGAARLMVGHVTSTLYQNVFSHNAPGPILFLLGLFAYIHSLYLLGASFVRSRKHAWIVTTVFIIIIGSGIGYIISKLMPYDVDITIDLIHVVGYTVIAVILALSIFNIWLSYRLFARRQLIGRFINC